MIAIEQTIATSVPDFFARQPQWLHSPLLSLIRHVCKESEINQFLVDHSHLSGLAFVESVLEHFEVGYSVSNMQRENIPSTGRVLIVANHPLGAMDALALIQMVSEIRSDVQVVAADYLTSIEPLNSILLPVNSLANKPGKANVKRILAALEAERAVIIFPAAEVSRARPRGIRDTKWLPGFVRFAQKTRSPIVPVYIRARNSRLFYSVSTLSKPLSSLLLVREMFKQRSKTLQLIVGEKISAESLSSTALPPRVKASLVKRHLYRVGTRRRGVFPTEQAIAHPEARKTLKAELRSAQILGQTNDGKQIYLVAPQHSPTLMREIGRLRELSFRQVGEGTGQRRDMDRYDRYYRQILLWDEQELEIAGAYRIGEGSEIAETHGLSGFYTYSLFKLAPEFIDCAATGIELGRSFVQPKYWGSRALDYLWQGIGAYLAKNPQVKWMFGPVSLSNSYPKGAKDLLVYFYLHFYPRLEQYAQSRLPYLLSQSELDQLAEIFSGETLNENFRILKDQLAHYDLSVPTLYKQYSELYETGGISFQAFNIDPDFSQCIDGFVLADLSKLKPAKYDRYIRPNLDEQPITADSGA